MTTKSSTATKRSVSAETQEVQEREEPRGSGWVQRRQLHVLRGCRHHSGSQHQQQHQRGNRTKIVTIISMGKRMNDRGVRLFDIETREH